MHVKALLDLDIVAMEASDELTLMLDLTAPANSHQTTRPSQAVQIVVDRSGSMAGDRLESAKGSLMRLIDRLAPQDFFGLVSFDDTALVEIPTRKMSEHHLPTLKKSVRELSAGGSTDISAGYLLGLREVSRVKAEGGATLLLISDGHANAGENDQEFFANVSAKFAKENVSTSSIGIGEGYDETILESLAKGGGGAHRFAGTIDEAIGAIAAEVDDLLDKTVVNAVLRISPTDAMKSAPLIELLHRLPYWKDGDSYVVQLGDFYSGENRRFVVKLEIPGVAGLGLCKIADITIEYLDLAALQEIVVTMPVNVNVVPGDIAAGRVADPIVRAERLVLEAQTAKSMAVEELRSGRSKEASSRLSSAAESLRLEASRIPVTDERSAESLAIIRAEAEVIEVLARTAEAEDAFYSSKLTTQSYSSRTRARNLRNQPTNPSPDDENLN